MEFPVWYPGEDDIPYLRHFAPHFPQVFIALNASTDVSSYVPKNDLESEFFLATDSVGAECVVTWRRVANLCGFKSIARVNRALRGTGSGRIRSNLGSQSDTRHLMEVCEANLIAPPYEGHFSPGTTRQIAKFLTALGHLEIIGDDWVFGGKLSRELVEGLFAASVRSEPRFYTVDHSLIVTMYIDYHYALVCQTEDSRQKANPADFFEGFDADETTNDYWGIGVNADA